MTLGTECVFGLIRKFQHIFYTHVTETSRGAEIPRVLEAVCRFKASREAVSSFPIATPLANNFEPSGLKQLSTLSSGSQEAPKSVLSHSERAVFPLKALGTFPCLFQFLEVACIPWLAAPSSIFKTGVFKWKRIGKGEGACLACYRCSICTCSTVSQAPPGEVPEHRVGNKPRVQLVLPLPPLKKKKALALHAAKPALTPEHCQA